MLTDLGAPLLHYSIRKVGQLHAWLVRFAQVLDPGWDTAWWDDEYLDYGVEDDRAAACGRPSFTAGTRS